MISKYIFRNVFAQFKILCQNNKKTSDSCKKIDLLFEQSVLKVNSEIDENIKADGRETLTSTNSATLDSLEVRKVKNDGNHAIAENTSNAVGREMSTSTNSATLDSLEVHKVIINNNDGDHDESDYQSTSCHSERTWTKKTSR